MNAGSSRTINVWIFPTQYTNFVVSSFGNHFLDVFFKKAQLPLCPHSFPPTPILLPTTASLPFLATASPPLSPLPYWEAGSHRPAGLCAWHAQRASGQLRGRLTNIYMPNIYITKIIYIIFSSFFSHTVFCRAGSYIAPIENDQVDLISLLEQNSDLSCTRISQQ